MEAVVLTGVLAAAASILAAVSAQLAQGRVQKKLLPLRDKQEKDLQNLRDNQERVLQSLRDDQEEALQNLRADQEKDLQNLRDKQERNLQQLHARLDRQKSREDAYREYEYAARTGLYAELGPKLFALSEACEEAYWRICSLAGSARRGKLVPGHDNRLGKNVEYRTLVMYRLVAPSVILALIQRRLTSVDLAVEPRVARMYQSAKMLRRCWNIRRELEELGGPPVVPQPTAGNKQPRQHVEMFHVDSLIMKMIVPDPGGDRVMTLAEFQRGYIHDPQLRSACSFFDDALKGFHPQRSPNLWYALMTYALVCRCVMDLAGLSGEHLPARYELPDLSSDRFDWRDPQQASTDMDVVLPLETAKKFLRSRLEWL